MATGSALTAVVVATVLFAVSAALFPHLVSFDDDGGDGLGNVTLPKPLSAVDYRRRLFAFFAIGGAITVLVNGSQRFQPSAWYAEVVGNLATAITGRSAEVQGYLSNLSVRIPLLWVVAFVSLTLVLRVTWGRRAAVLLHAGLYLVIAVLLQAAWVTVSVQQHLPLAMSGIAAVIINLFVGTLVSMRLVLTTFALPRANALPKSRPFQPVDSIVIVSGLIIGVALPVVALSWVSAPSRAGSEWQRLVPLFVLPILSASTGVGLLVLRGRRGTLPPPLDEPPSIDVITPAFNEEAGIALTLESIDRAAAGYGGTVQAIVSNDGSTDETKRIAMETMEKFQHAVGIFIDHANTGKAGALNRALAVAETEIVVRLDGDCVMDDDALTFTAPWFADPKVGIVGSRMLPRQDCDTWYSRMRGIECLLGFGCTRMGQQVVDGIGVVPGTYTAFLRAPMVGSGGFVDGMNGEDADQTCQFGRMGYRVVIDPRVVCYEDVPPTMPEFVEQRTRWARANVHVFARHNPLRNGLAGPRVWFYMWRRGAMWAQAPLIILAPLFFILALGNTVTRSSAVYLVMIPLVLASFWLGVLVAAAARYNYWGVVAWFPTYLAFSFLRRIALMEAFLSLPTRPLWRTGGPIIAKASREGGGAEPEVIHVPPARLRWEVA
jgi:cellulose synthase/poly-beta-1,6-N-acetylglucosamine synthase-like glycosyltransferase